VYVSWETTGVTSYSQKFTWSETNNWPGTASLTCLLGLAQFQLSASPYVNFCHFKTDGSVYYDITYAVF